jgi:hypothetical protein
VCHQIHRIIQAAVVTLPKQREEHPREGSQGDSQAQEELQQASYGMENASSEYSESGKHVPEITQEFRPDDNDPYCGSRPEHILIEAAVCHVKSPQIDHKDIQNIQQIFWLIHPTLDGSQRQQR